MYISGLSNVLAATYDEDMTISCDAATGDNAAFHAWIEGFWHEEVREVLADPDAISECGGGSEALYWYEQPDGSIIGLTSGRYSPGYYHIPADADMPEIVGFRLIELTADWPPDDDEEEA